MGTAFGATTKQVLRKIQVPLAKPSIMLGVNQALLMAFGMVVIAAIVGVENLGREVLNGLQHLDVGVALNAGIAIVVLAIVLDRVSEAWSTRDRATQGRGIGGVRASRSPDGRSSVLAIAATLVAVLVGRYVLVQQDFPASPRIDLVTPTNTAVEWIQTNLEWLTSAIGDFLILYCLDPIVNLLLGVPWWMVAGFFAVAAWRFSGWKLAVFTGSGVPRHRPPRDVGRRDEHAQPGRGHRGDRARDRDPARASSPAGAIASNGPCGPSSTRCR